MRAETRALGVAGQVRLAWSVGALAVVLGAVALAAHVALGPLHPTAVALAVVLPVVAVFYAGISSAVLGHRAHDWASHEAAWREWRIPAWRRHRNHASQRR